MICFAVEANVFLFSNANLPTRLLESLEKAQNIFHGKSILHKFVEPTDCFNIPKRYQKRLKRSQNLLLHFLFLQIVRVVGVIY